MTLAQALQSLVGSAAVAVGLVIQSWLSRRFQRSQKHELSSQVAKVQETVNGNTDAAVKRIDQLQDALVAANVEIPHRPNGPEEGA